MGWKSSVSLGLCILASEVQRSLDLVSETESEVLIRLKALNVPVKVMNPPPPTPTPLCNDIFIQPTDVSCAHLRELCTIFIVATWMVQTILLIKYWRIFSTVKYFYDYTLENLNLITKTSYFTAESLFLSLT